MQWTVLILTASMMFGSHVAPRISATGRDSGAADRRDHENRDDHPPIKHVFVIVLENEGFDTTFGAQSKAPKSAGTGDSSRDASGGATGAVGANGSGVAE